MEAKVLETIEEFFMLQKGNSVLVGVSGGVDSVVLLHLLLSLKKHYSLKVFAAHVNHQIRGAEAQRDEQFVKHLCQKLGVLLYFKSVNVLELAKATGCSVEEAARNARYAELLGFAAELGAKIATAHNLNDNIETVMLNLTRGTGLKGLCGIPPVRGKIIRPLLNITRAEIEGYAQKNGLEFVTDSTNADIKYKRNRIRRGLTPQLFELNPAFAKVFLRTCRSLREDEEFLEKEAKKALYRACFLPGQFLVAELVELPSSLKFRAIRQILAQNNVLCEASKVLLVDKIMKAGCGRVNLCGTVFCRVKAGVLRVEKKEAGPCTEEFIPVTLPGPGAYSGPLGQTLVLKEQLPPEVLVQKQNRQGLGPWVFNKEAVQGSLVMRTRRPGDKLRLCGSNGTKTLKKLFNERKVPVEKRASRLLLADDVGVVWVDGLGPDARVSVDKTTKNLLGVEVKQ